MGVFLFFLFLVLFTFFLAITSYYAGILFFTAKESYRREELTEIRSEVLRLILDTWESGGSILRGSLIFFGGALLSGLWSSIGTLLGDPGPGVFEHIFHTPIFFLGLFFAYPVLVESLQNDPILNETNSALSGLALGNLSSAVLHYGLDRDLFFLFVLFLFLLQFPILVFLWNRRAIFGVQFGPSFGGPLEEWGSVPSYEEDEFGEDEGDFSYQEHKPHNASIQNSPKENKNDLKEFQSEDPKPQVPAKAPKESLDFEFGEEPDFFMDDDPFGGETKP